MSNKIIYEITATVSDKLADDYAKYMREAHIPDLLATGYFSEVFLTRAGENRFRIQYHAHNQNSLDEYLKRDAARLRQDFADHFPEGVTVSRENWEILESW
jgi:hypothetical protein